MSSQEKYEYYIIECEYGESRVEQVVKPEKLEEQIMYIAHQLVKPVEDKEYVEVKCKVRKLIVNVDFLFET